MRIFTSTSSRSLLERPGPAYHSSMGMVRLPHVLTTSSRAPYAKSVEALSAEVAALQTLPPMVPETRSCGPPGVSQASPSVGTVAWMTGLVVTWWNHVMGPISTVPSSARVTPSSSSCRLWMETRWASASLPPRTFTSTSVPPAITMAWGSSAKARQASSTLVASYRVSMSYIRSAPPS